MTFTGVSNKSIDADPWAWVFSRFCNYRILHHPLRQNVDLTGAEMSDNFWKINTDKIYGHRSTHVYFSGEFWLGGCSHVREFKCPIPVMCAYLYAYGFNNVLVTWRSRIPKCMCISFSLSCYRGSPSRRNGPATKVSRRRHETWHLIWHSDTGSANPISLL